MKKLLVLIAVLIAAVSFAVFAKKYPGYMLIDINGYTLEMTLLFAGIVIIASFAALYAAIRLLANLSRVPRDIRYWQDKRAQGKADQALISGLIKLAECKWPAAEQQVLRHVDQAKTPLLNYLAAARAAQEQGAFDRRDKYLNLAHQSQPEASIAIAVTQAELQLAQNQKEQALATLRHLQQLDPKQPKVLKNLAKLYADMTDWENVIQIIPALRKNKVMADDVIKLLEKTAFLFLLRQADVMTQANLQDLWQRIPTNMQADEEILVAYIEQMLNRDKSDVAEPLIRNALKKKWNEKLVQLYGVIEAVDPHNQMVFIEGLLSHHQNDPMLLLTLGRLSLRNKLWGKARTYLEASIGASPNAQAYAELGRLLEGLGEKEAAMDCYSKGLALIPSCGVVTLGSQIHGNSLPSELGLPSTVTKLLANST